MAKKARNASKKWTEQTREYLMDFLDETDLLYTDSIGESGSTFRYPKWLIMFITVLSVKLKIKTYPQIHKIAIEYWDLIAKDLKLK